jgi:putative tryptophan/tyrosine transport system substrate-binding protein
MHRAAIVDATARHRLPTIFPYRFNVAEGGLMSYGVNLLDLYRGAAAFVDRILRGERAAEMPVQQPIKFELIINLKAANALGLTIPPTLLARADEVIE